MKHIKFIMPMLIFTLLFIISCSKSPEEQILGKWQVEGGTIEFSENGDLIFSSPGGGMTAHWEIPEEGNILVTFPDKTTDAGTYIFSGQDKLVITGSDKTKRELTRIESSSEQSSTDGVIGSYGGEKCYYEKLELRKGGKLYVTWAGMEIPGTYEIDGDRVSIHVNDDSWVFKRNGNSLSHTELGACAKI